MVNAKAAPEDIEDVSEGRLRLGGVEDNVVHQALHGHVETVGVGQHLDCSSADFEFSLPTFVEIKATAFRKVRE